MGGRVQKVVSAPHGQDYKGMNIFQKLSFSWYVHGEREGVGVQRPHSYARCHLAHS
jgi:hypothetical protein